MSIFCFYVIFLDTQAGIGLGDIYWEKKIIGSPYIGIFQIIDKIIDIRNQNLEIIDKLSILENASNVVR